MVGDCRGGRRGRTDYGGRRGQRRLEAEFHNACGKKSSSAGRVNGNALNLPEHSHTPFL